MYSVHLYIFKRFLKEHSIIKSIYDIWVNVKKLSENYPKHVWLN